MYRTLRRFASLTVGFWFVLALTGQATLHRCPVHDAPTQQSTSHQSHHADSHSTGHQCHCIQHCNSAAVTAALPSSGIHFEPTRALTHTASKGTSADATSLLDFRVLFPTGPPVSSALIA